MSLITLKLRQYASEKPDFIAVKENERNTSYAELLSKVEATARWIKSQNCRTLGFKVQNGLEWVVLDLAALEARVNIVPIPEFFTKSQTQHSLDDANVDLFISDEEIDLKDSDLAGKWENTSYKFFQNTHCVQREIIPELDMPTHENLSPKKITYTSGSTGTPKGVCLETETIDTVSASIVKAMENIEVNTHLCILPLATLLENIAGLYAPILRGISLYVGPSNETGLKGASLDIESFCKLINKVKPESIILVPQLLTALVTLGEMDMIQTSQFRMIAVGGGRISEHLLASAEKLSLPVCQGYGLSECCSVLTLNLPGASKGGSVGRALPHAELRISDTGEIEARGSNMQSYLGEKEVLYNWYATGDLGHMDEDGFLFITGRKKNVFITSFGRNVNPEWVESSLTQQVAVSQALAYGESRDHNLALIWLRFPQSAGELELIINKANKGLPDYAQVHAYIVMEEALAESMMTSNGRIKRGLVTTLYENQIESHFKNQQALVKDKKHGVL